MRTILLTILAAASFSATADFTQSGNTITFDDQWWQVETAWTPNAGSRIVCSGGADESCALDPGSYKWLGSSGHGLVDITAASNSGPVSVSQRITCIDKTVAEVLLETTNMMAFPAMECTLTCPTGEILISPTCQILASSVITANEGVYPLEAINALSGFLKFNGTNEATCNLYGQYDQYIVDQFNGEPLYPADIKGTTLSGTALCLKVN